MADRTRKLLNKLVKEGRPTPRLAEIAGYFVEMVGGPYGFAKMLHTEFLKAPMGSLARQRILGDIMASLKFANTREGSASELGMLNDADLEKELDTALAEVSLGEPEATPDAKDKGNGQEETHQPG